MNIVLDKVSKKIRDQEIIKDISISMESGKIYGLSGHNGCGKTMLMRLIAGLIYPTSGLIRYDDKILGKDFDFPPDIGILIENPSFLGGYTAAENLKLLSKIKNKTDFSTIEKAVERVGLKDAANKKFRKYSLGMKQRLGIAAAIFESPSVIILDEPTNALDSQGVTLIKQIISDESKRGALIIMACHEKTILNELCDTIFIIENGSLISTENV